MVALWLVADESSSEGHGLPNLESLHRGVEIDVLVIVLPADAGDASADRHPGACGRVRVHAGDPGPCRGLRGRAVGRLAVETWLGGETATPSRAAFPMWMFVPLPARISEMIVIAVLIGSRTRCRAVSCRISRGLARGGHTDDLAGGVHLRTAESPG